MRRITRTALSSKTERALARVTTRIVAEADPKAYAEKKWKSKPRVAFEEVRSSLEAMATGRSRCMYCEDSMGTDIDHFRPKSNYPDQAFVWGNYLLACGYCNSNLKRTQFPLDAHGNPLLIDPTVDDPEQHLKLLPSTGEFSAITQKGSESIRVFGLNDNAMPRRLPKGRRDSLISLVALLKEYDAEIQVNPGRAASIQDAIRDFPFSVVLSYLVGVAGSAVGVTLLGQQVVGIINRHGVGRWI